MASLMEVSRSWGQIEEKKGMISGWLNSTTTTTRSPGFPGSLSEGNGVVAGVFVGVTLAVAVGGMDVFVGVFTGVFVGVFEGVGVMEGVAVGAGGPQREYRYRTLSASTPSMV